MRIDKAILDSRLSGLEFSADLSGRSHLVKAPPKPFAEAADKAFSLIVGSGSHSPWVCYNSEAPLIGNRGERFQLPIASCKFSSHGLTGYFYFNFCEITVVLDGVGSLPTSNFESQNRIAVELLSRHTTWKLDTEKEKLNAFGDSKPFEPTAYGPIKCNWVAVTNLDGKLNSGGNDVGRKWGSLVNFKFAKDFTMMQIMVTQWYDVAFGNVSRDMLIGEPNQSLSAIDEVFWSKKKGKSGSN